VFLDPTLQALEMLLVERKANAQAQCEHRERMTQPSPKRKPHVVARDIEDEMYWVVRNEMMKRLSMATPESLMNVSTKSVEHVSCTR